MKKSIVLFAILFSTINLRAQTDSIPNSSNDKTVTITVTGQGKTIDEAKTNALRSSIEQAFGAFISSNTTILNDSLVKDEIVSVTNGNIQKYDVLNQTILPDGSNLTTLKATVSIKKLTTFCEAKGINVEFKGGLFAMNVAIQELNDKSELKAWENTKKIIDEFIPQCLDYQINVQDPVLILDTKYNIPVNINVVANENYQKLIDLVLNFCKSTTMSNDDKNNYVTHGKKVYELLVDTSKVMYLENFSGSHLIIFRNQKVFDEILNIPRNLITKGIVNFRVNNGIDTFSIVNYIKDTNYTTLRNKIYIDRKVKLNRNIDILTCIDYNNFLEKKIRGYENKSCGGLGFEIPEWIGADEKFRFICYKNYDGANTIEELINPMLASNEFTYYSKNENQIKCLLFHRLVETIAIKFNDIRDIEEIKKITEYKIEIKK
jgi:hypothetical protein